VATSRMLTLSGKEEETRLRDQHEMVKLIFHDWPNHHLHPDFIGEPRRVLDCGFGTGDWAYDLADYDPDCQVSYSPARLSKDRSIDGDHHPGVGCRHLP